jgi:hypothetical protein
MYSNKVSLKGSLLLLSSIGILSLISSIPKALAGGGDEIALTDANGNLITVNAQNQSVGSIPTFLDWAKWQKPASNGETVCREKDGKII